MFWRDSEERGHLEQSAQAGRQTSGVRDMTALEGTHSFSSFAAAVKPILLDFRGQSG